MENKVNPSVYDIIKESLQNALDNLEWLGLEPVWRLKSGRPFFTDEYGKPTCYLNVGDYKVEGEEPFASILPSDIMKEENPFWGFVDYLLKIKNQAASEDLLVEKKGVWKGSESKQVQQRMNEIDFKVKSQYQLEILWMYFMNKRWVENNQTGFKKCMIEAGRYTPRKGNVRDVKNIDLTYIQKVALPNAIKKRGFEDLESQYMNYKTLEQFLNKCDFEYRDKGVKLNKTESKWLEFKRYIEMVFKGIGQV